MRTQAPGPAAVPSASPPPTGRDQATVTDDREPNGVAARIGLLHHARLITEARSLVLEGWPIAAASWWSAAEECYFCGRGSCPRTDRHLVDLIFDPEAAVACDPALDRAVLTDSQTASLYWAHRPYAPALVVGHGIEALEAPAELAENTVTRVTSTGLTPIVATSDLDRALFFTRPPESDPIGALRSLADAGVQRHPAGTWLVLPPAALPSGPATWTRPPEAAGWKLPAFAAILNALAAAAANPACPAQGIQRGNGHHPPPPPSASQPDRI